MKTLKRHILLGLSLIVLAVILHFIHYLIFRDAKQLLFYTVDDIAFIPVQVLLVTLVISELLSARDKRAKMLKLNMAIGVFFSEVGTKLLTLSSEFSPDIEELKQKLVVTSEWSDKQLSIVSRQLKAYEYTMVSQNGNLLALKTFITGERDFLLSLLNNPNLLEHDRFTDLLWAVFHLMEELAFRKDVTQLSDKDYNHISGDMKRAYTLLIHEWLQYMKHLKNHYPYLFSLAMRTNPFDPDATPEINIRTQQQSLILEAQASSAPIKVICLLHTITLDQAVPKTTRMRSILQVSIVPVTKV
jgi:hypothetical protein